MKIETVMTRDVVCVSPDTQLKEVATLLASHRISGAPVCDEQGRVLGVISETDVLPYEAGAAPQRLARLRCALPGRAERPAVRSASDVMTVPALTIRPLQHVRDAARVMLEKDVNRLPVVSDGRLVGIVSRGDLVRAFSRSDAEIGREIREEVLLGTMLRSPDEFQVEVASGRVFLRGRVESAQDAQVLERCIRHVAGVVDLEADLDIRSSRAAHAKIIWTGRA